MNNPILTGAALCLAVLGLESRASAYEYWTCLGSKITWSSGSPTMRLSSVSFPSGSWRTAMTDVCDHWSDGPAQFEWNVVYGDTSVGVGNFQNEAWFTTSQSLLNGAPARCISWSYCANWAEADIVFDAAVAYTTSTSKTALTPYGGASRPFRTTALHELGHGVGLKHENDEYNIMGQDWDHIHANGSTARAYAGEDGFDGAVYLYGTASGRQDVGVVHWKWTGRSGEYSTHARTSVFKQNGALAPGFTDRTFNANGEPGFKVSRGETIQVELSFENNGASSQSPLVEYYVSTNDFISTFDTFVGSRRPTVNRNGVYTFTQTIVVPSNLTVGAVYYVGAVVDPDDDIDEFDEGNNATYIAIKIES